MKMSYSATANSVFFIYAVIGLVRVTFSDLVLCTLWQTHSLTSYSLSCSCWDDLCIIVSFIL